VVRCRAKVRSPQQPLKNSDLAPYLRTVVKCLVTAFAKPLASQGFTLTTPKIKTYGKRISTPCGKYGQDVAPAYYCSATQTIYWPQTSDDGREAYTIARLGYVGLVAHEFGHHLQATTGMLNEYSQKYYGTKKKSTRYQLSRRLELQAQCFEGVFLAVVAKSIKLSARDRAQIRAWHSYTGDEDPPSDRLPDHGTSSAQLRWLNRGIDSADFGRCNTWKVASKSVK
jgi:predicted metalloprotease